MRNTTIAMVLSILVIILAACQPAKKDVITNEELTKIKEDMTKTTPAQQGTTGNAAVDAVGKDLNQVSNEEKELSTDQLGDLDSGLNDVENI
ncbi:MAG: hypothetical protein AABX33_04675 [Nanoarchaeota archaeon]